MSTEAAQCACACDFEPLTQGSKPQNVGFIVGLIINIIIINFRDVNSIEQVAQQVK